MRIVRAELRNFRNYGDGACDFDPQVNVITGQNAQGKTNLLEAVFYLAGARSFRTRFDRDVINLSETEAALTGYVASEIREQQIDIYLNFIGNFPIPAEALIAEETPEEKELAEKRAGYRRKYQRRKELAAQRAAEAEQQNKASA